MAEEELQGQCLEPARSPDDQLVAIGVDAEPRPDPAYARSRDIPHLVGDSTKLRRATGWAPALSLDLTLRGLLDAEAD